ncbi:MAG: GGDEF domain-containing protein [Clostridiales bacterium]|nr:GGDEF domain-containing protein [Clostridiales bacterium]
MTIGVSGTIMTAFIVLQTFDAVLPFYAIGCLITTCTIHSFITEDERIEHSIQIGTVRNKAFSDPLTGVKSIHAYQEAKENVDRRIRDGLLSAFGVIIFDLNNLKLINDTNGHNVGDKCIQEASRIICYYFTHSPVYRIGGDEFVAFIEGSDYENRYDLLAAFDNQIEENQNNGSLVVVSSGLAEYNPEKDERYQMIFDRADQKMYERKKHLKTEKITKEQP